MANGHSGARPGAGRKKKALSEKLIDGNPGKAPLKKIQFDIKESDMHGEDMLFFNTYFLLSHNFP